MPPAPGQDFDEYMAEDASGFPLQAGVICIVLVTIAYFLRLVSRHIQRAPWGWDDTLMVPAYLATVGTGASVIYAALNGSGHHIEWFISNMLDKLDSWGVNCIYINAFVYLVAVTAPKLAILILYLRIFIDRFSRWTCWITIAVLLLNMIVNYFTVGFQCDHFDYGWKPWLWDGNCDDILKHYTWAAMPNIVTDIVMLLLPLPALWRLKLPIQVKMGLVLTLLVGSFGLVTAIVRFVEFNTPVILEDITWNVARLEAWAVIEVSMYCISASLLTYRPLLRRILGRKMDPSSSYAGTNRTQDSRSWTATPAPPPPMMMMTKKNIDDGHSRTSSQTLEPPPPTTFGGASSNGLYTWEVEAAPMAEPKAALFPVGVTRYDYDYDYDDDDEAEHQHAQPRPHPRNCPGCDTCLYSNIQRSLSIATATTLRGDEHV